MFARRKLLREVEVVRVRPGDVIVYRSDLRLSREACERIRDTLAPIFPANEIAVLDAGGRLMVMSPEAANVRS